jgi:hypothetical protein
VAVDGYVRWRLAEATGDGKWVNECSEWVNECSEWVNECSEWVNECSEWVSSVSIDPDPYI